MKAVCFLLLVPALWLPQGRWLEIRVTEQGEVIRSGSFDTAGRAKKVTLPRDDDGRQNVLDLLNAEHIAAKPKCLSDARFSACILLLTRLLFSKEECSRPRSVLRVSALGM